jgi:hypothetical protein
MNDRETEIITKLISIASSQQKIIRKLAQDAVDPNIRYLTEVAQVAAANVGFTATNVIVTVKPGGDASPEGGGELISTPKGYIVSLSGAPSDTKTRQKFIDIFTKQVQSQKPEISSNVSILFN